MSVIGFFIQKTGYMTKILTDWYIKCSVYEKFVGKGRIHSVQPIFKVHNSQKLRIIYLKIFLKIPRLLALLE